MRNNGNGNASGFISMGRVPVDKRVPMLVIEIDGSVLVNETDLGHPRRHVDDVIVHDGAVAQMKAWKANGGRIIGIGNAGDIALGLIDFQEYFRLMQHMVNAVAARCDGNRLFDKLGWCAHHPDAIDPEYARCWCRLPSPGLIIEVVMAMAAGHREMYPPYMGLFVGSTTDGEQAAKLAGFPFKPASAWLREGKALPK